MKKTIDFAEGLKLPIEVASSPVALLAQRGRGKTRAAKKLAEAFHAAGVPPVIVDPAGVWWGLRVAADGKSRGLDLPVLGGLHGDQPLVPTGGKVLAEALVRTRRGCVIDTTALASEGEKKRFVTDFAETFLRQKVQHRTPVHLILEEADEWIPEQPAADEARMLGAFGRIVRIGRNFGVGITMISQRPQGISKKLLNLSEIVVVLGMAGAHEQAAMRRWMDDHDVTPERRAEVLEKMPRLGWNKFHKTDGGALIWAPLLDLFGVYKVKDAITLDSSATPEVGDDGEAAPLPALDLDDLAKAMSATVEEAKANDPKLLRARVAELERTLAAKPSIVEPSAPIVKVEKEYLIPERTLEVLEKLKVEARERAGASANAEADLWKAVDALTGEIRRVTTPLGDRGRPAPRHAISPRTTAAAIVPRAARPRPAREESGDGTIAPAMRRLLAALAQHGGAASKKRLAVLCGYSASGGGYRNYLGALRGLGLIEYQGGDVVLTDAGAREAKDAPPPPATLEERLTIWRAALGGSEMRILETLVDAHPKAVTKDSLAEATGYEPTGGGFRNYLGKLRGLGLIDYAGGGVRASDDLVGGG